MVISGTHWFFAMGIALSIHLAGLWWLSLPAPASQPVSERTSESIVVTLGREARRATQNVQALDPEASTDVTGSTVAEAKPPEETSEVTEAAPVEASEPAPAEAGTPPTVMNLETVDPAAPVAPETVEAAISSEPRAVEPETVAAKELSGAEISEPGAVDVQTVSDPAPVSPESAEVRELADAGGDSLPAEAPEVVEAAVEDVPGNAAPAEFAEDAPVPEPAGSITVAPVENGGGVAAADKPGIDVSAVDPARDEVAVVEEVSTLQAGQSAAVTPVESVEAQTVEEPVTEVAAVSEPDVSEAAEPETIDLQELQESGGGEGVVARYAGVLKGWLQKNMHYPRAARLAGQEGEVVVRFVIDRGGKVQSIRVESKSGFPLLDREAREMIERGDPFPAIPEDMPGQRLEIRVPVSFNVRDETLTKEIPPIYLE